MNGGILSLYNLMGRFQRPWPLTKIHEQYDKQYGSCSATLPTKSSAGDLTLNRDASSS
ncbi:Uncharacterized protein TCM_020732 [Theobroma cacao]|uniref:Uncharacterized protein n=1 Tax=Theobroma cacao TaxID=3641 RepID=A0A061ELC5_THECC|nr:Uncharacterized protein TCM_020732 [Theobroma cacao]